MEKLGVPINLSKSVVAQNESFEFAKMTGHKGNLVSAFSWKMLISQNTMLGRVNIVYSILSKSIYKTKLISWIHHAMRRKYSQGDTMYYLISLCCMLINTGKVSLLDVLCCMDPDKISKVTYKQFLESFSQKKLETVINATFKGKPFDVGRSEF
jgi:hypothetical protein